ncbi:MAG: hypothetical protein K2H22_04380, partial [Muribaculaceae bacterium]|nr:hypothetical protein [Muribaculaceae bacterium]
IILVDDPDSLSSSFRLVSRDALKTLFAEHPEITVEPWGWNPALIRLLTDSGVPPAKLPDASAMARIRSLAHRRTTVLLNTLWNDKADRNYHVDVPVELTSIDECMAFYRSHNGCWMKAPWSSSGRGVINTAADMTDNLVEQWCHGILRRQGSVMGESGADRISDYATEWQISSGEAFFLGLSSFSTSNRGKYISNHHMSQAEMKWSFDSLSRMKLHGAVELQKEILESVLQDYEGLCGVDMLIERDGHLRPFVELNLRRTMGMLYINQSEESDRISLISLYPFRKNSER